MMAASSSYAELKSAAYDNAVKDGGSSSAKRHRKKPSKPFSEMRGEEYLAYLGELS